MVFAAIPFRNIWPQPILGPRVSNHFGHQAMVQLTCLFQLTLDNFMEKAYLLSMVKKMRQVSEKVSNEQCPCPIADVNDQQIQND